MAMTDSKADDEDGRSVEPLDIDIEQTDPHKIIRTKLPQDTTVESRVVLTAAMRNPDASFNEIAGFCGTSHPTVVDATAAFYRGMFAKKGSQDRTGDSSAAGLSDEALQLTDLTPKKRAIVEFFARYPKVPNEVDDWTWNDVQSYLSEHHGVEVSSTYPINVKNDHAEFIERYRDRLKDEGRLPDEDVPEKTKPLPDTVAGRLQARVTLPDENLDDFDNPEETWVDPYRKVDLRAVAEGSLPHTEQEWERFDRDLAAASRGVSESTGETDGGGTGETTTDPRSETMADTDDDTDPDSETDTTTEPTPNTATGGGSGGAASKARAAVTRERGNARYQGPETGIDARTQRLTHLSEIASKATGEEPSETVEVAVPMPLLNRLQNDVTNDHFESVEQALIKYAIGEAEAHPDDADHHLAATEVSAVFDELRTRYEGYRDILKSEHDLHASENTAARLTVINFVLRAMDETIDEHGIADASDG